MAIVQPGGPDPTQSPGTGGHIGAPEPAPSESGMGLEATLPSVPPRLSLTEELASLDEPSGAFAPPSRRNNGPAPSLEPTSPGATPPAAPVSDNFNARFERVLDTVRANRPHDDLDLIRAAWAFCQEQHEGQRRASGE